MKVLLIVILSICHVFANIEYPRPQDMSRYNPKGVPSFPRRTPLSNFDKKWKKQAQLKKRRPPMPINQMSQNLPNRPYPQMQQVPHHHAGSYGRVPANIPHNNIPVHMSHGMPHNVPLNKQYSTAQSQHRPVVVPYSYRPNLKSTPQLQTVSVHPNVIPKEPQQYLLPQKFVMAEEPQMFYSANFNNITIDQIKPIKQVGEKGPIRTIPAPNLSAADKMAFMGNSQNQQEAVFKKNSQNNMINREFISYQNQNNNNNNNIYHQYQVTESFENIQPEKLYMPQAQPLQFNIQYQSSTPGQKNLPQQFDNPPQQQVQPQNVFVVEQYYEQPHQNSNEQANQLKIEQQAAQLEALLNPHVVQFGTYNTNSDAIPEQSIERSSTNHTSAESLDDDSEDLEMSEMNQQSPNSQEAAHVVAQSQRVQDYFDTRIFPADAKVQQQEPEPEMVLDEELVGSSFSSLPSREIAERFAQLHAAGEINRNLMQINPKTLITKVKLPRPLMDSQRRKSEVEDDGGSEEYEDDEEINEAPSVPDLSNFGQKLRAN